VHLEARLRQNELMTEALNERMRKDRDKDRD